MAVLEIPIVSDPPCNEFQLTLEGVVYTLRQHYNARRGVWHLGIKTEFGEDIVNGVPVFVNWPIFDRYRDIRLPPGTFLAVDTEGQSRDPGQYDFGVRVKLLYLESEGAA